MLNKSKFISKHNNDITSDYRVIKDLSKGKYFHVFRVQSIITGNIYCCKKIMKRKIKNIDNFLSYIDLMKNTDHPHIVKIYDIYEDKFFMYLIMEECLGDDLFSRISSDSKDPISLTEKEAAELFKQILSAINYLHSQKINIKEITPEHIMFTNIDEESPIKLIDFGLSKTLNEDNNIMDKKINLFTPPEEINGTYTVKSDVWSCGVILYTILCGQPPFYEQDQDKLKNKILNMEYDFNKEQFDKVSSDAKEVIKKILVDESNRPSVAEIIEYSWVKENAPNSRNESLNIDWGHIAKYSKLNILKKSVINFTAFRLSSNDTRKFVDMFKTLDANSDGVLTLDEIRDGIKKCDFGKDINSENLVELFNQMDVDKNGEIDYNEFVSSLLDYEKDIKIEQLYECFRVCDKDNSGKISFEELCEMVKSESKEEQAQLKELFNKFDIDGDGEIDFGEFLDGFNKI